MWWVVFPLATFKIFSISLAFNSLTSLSHGRALREESFPDMGTEAEEQVVAKMPQTLTTFTVIEWIFLIDYFSIC